MVLDRGNSPAKQRVSVVVTDLDDTVWDWVLFWYTSFKPMYDEIKRLSGLSDEVLQDSFRRVFSAHKTSEYVFVIQELPCLLERHPSEELPGRYFSAIEACRRGRRLRPHPYALRTLRRLKALGVLLIAYSESKAFYAAQRVRKVGLDGVLDFLYTPPDDDVTDDETRRELRGRRFAELDLQETVARQTPPGAFKPCPEILHSILADVGAPPDQTIYVGDKLFKDVVMAQDAGVTDVWAKYGQSHWRDEYELLKKVTHWSQEQVQAEVEATPDSVEPSYVLEKSMWTLLRFFDFIPFRSTTTS